jgi:hypothetical protein
MQVNASDTDLLNELRGASGLNMGFGILAWLGVFYAPMRITSLKGCIFCFSLYLTGRLAGYVLDGPPNADIQQGMATEFVLGGLNIAALLLSERSKGEKND